MTQEIAIINTEELTTANQVLKINKSYLTAYDKSQAKLLSKAKEEGAKLTSKTDEEFNKWLVSAKLCLKAMKEQRTPITAMLHRGVKLFTEIENGLDEKYEELQSIRNASVSAYRKEEEETRRKEELELQKKQERITLLADAKNQVREAYANILRDEKADLLLSFEATHADNIDEVESELRDLKPVLLFNQWESIAPEIQSRILTKEELHAIATNSKLGKFDKCAAHFTKEMKAYADYLLEMIPERRKEIEAGQQSKEAEALRRKQAALEEAQRKEASEKAEAARLAEIREHELAMQIEQANRKSVAPNTRAIDSYSITVTGKEGWRAIIEFYLQNSTETDLGKIKLDQMKAFAERERKKSGNWVDHKEVGYDTVYKAVAKAARKEKVDA